MPHSWPFHVAEFGHAVRRSPNGTSHHKIPSWRRTILLASSCALLVAVGGCSSHPEGTPRARLSAFVESIKPELIKTLTEDGRHELSKPINYEILPGPFPSTPDTAILTWVTVTTTPVDGKIMLYERGAAEFVYKNNRWKCQRYENVVENAKVAPGLSDNEVEVAEMLRRRVIRMTLEEWDEDAFTNPSDPFAALLARSWDF